MLTTLLVVGLLTMPHAHAQVRGESIFGSAETNSNIKALVLPVQTKDKTTPAARTNLTAGEFVGFDQLSAFDMNLTDDLELNTNNPAWADAKVNAMIPARVRALDSRDISVEGFMLPVEFEKNKVVEFMLARDPMGCCYSTVPEINQFIYVRVKPPGVEPVIFNTSRARGVFHVGAERGNGALTTIYRMDAESVK
jgi:hypothetical protein